MNVISGKYKGLHLYTPQDVKIKPTLALVKRALFDFLTPVLDSKSFLDLYAGSGALGIEALSHGAGRVVFVEKDPRCVKTISKNISRIKDIDADIIALDVFKALRLLEGEKFDIVFMDPPYRDRLLKSTLLEILKCDIVNNNSLLIAEHHKKEIINNKIGDFVLKKQRKYGETIVSIFELGDKDR